jgi:superfamily II DNA/RNA helicase
MVSLFSIKKVLNSFLISTIPNRLDPTPIQEAAIPLILEGRDILAKARTG